MGTEQRKHSRVVFARGVAARILAIDGTWCHDVMMEDVSATGAKLTLEHPLDRTITKEFFLALSTTGKVFRRCELAWVNGNQLGATFVTRDNASQKSRKPALRPPQA
ncbi:MAG: PilZ domain-containing protein [Bradyrhizobium sp.]